MTNDEAIEMIRNDMKLHHDSLSGEYRKALRMAISALSQPQRIKGRWIHDGCDIPHGVDWMHCSVCGRREPYVPAAMTNYCPTCGTEMETELQ